MAHTTVGDRDLLPARRGVRADEVAIAGPSLAGQPGRRAGHHHRASDPGDYPQAAKPDAARRPVDYALVNPHATEVGESVACQRDGTRVLPRVRDRLGSGVIMAGLLCGRQWTR